MDELTSLVQTNRPEKTYTKSGQRYACLSRTHMGVRLPRTGGGRGESAQRSGASLY